MSLTGKDIFGYLLLIIIGLFGAALIWKQVDEATSYGLRELFTILAVLAGAFGQSYFAERRAKNGAAPEPQKNVQG
jgi:uncharacterized membrane protein YgdD (TMEM256/DUF423 family)